MTAHAGRLPQTKGGGARAAVRGERGADRAARKAFHSRRMWPATLAALLLSAAGIVVAIEVVSALAGSPALLVAYDSMTSWAAGTNWNEWVVRAISAGVALLGLVFLLAGLLPGRGRVVPLHGESRRLVMGVTRGGLKGAVSSAASGVEGVSRVSKVKVRRHKVKVTARTGMHRPIGLRDEVRAAVRERLDELGPLPRRRVKVRIETPADRGQD